MTTLAERIKTREAQVVVVGSHARILASSRTSIADLVALRWKPSKRWRHR